MTLSHIHLPSINSVLTSERVFLPGQFLSTKLDMGAAETKSFPDPDYLMRTVHLDEAPCVGHQVSSFNIGYNLDTIVEEDESDSMAMTNEGPSTTSSRSSSPSHIPKHDCGVLASSLRIFYSINVIRLFTRRRGSRGSSS